MKLKILVIDDERSILKTFKLRLTRWGHEVFLASDGNFGMDLLSQVDCHLVITDLKMPGMGGEKIVKLIKQNHPETEIVVITGYASVEVAVDIMKEGITDFFVKPLNFDQIRIVIDKICERIALKEENRLLKDRVGELKNKIEQHDRMYNLVGKSKKMRDIFKLITKVAPLNTTILLSGETGTGKEMIAKAIYHIGTRKDGPIITVDCGTLAETLLEAELFGYEQGAFTGAVGTKRGLFEQADGGTIFLDEVENASPAVQKKLLRLIQEKTFQRLGGEAPIKVNVRVIAASNQNLLQLVREKKFRQDLYYRLNVVPITIPPLRERTEDIPLLTRYFVDIYTKRLEQKPMEITPESIKLLINYSWPGNVRELINVIERTIIMTPGNTINKFYLSDEHEPEDIFSITTKISLDPPLKEQISLLEQRYLCLALERYHGRIKDVAERSGLNARTLFRKMEQYKLNKKDFN